MADVPMQIIVAAFHTIDGASNALQSLQDAKREKLLDIEDAAVITKDANGKVKIKETADMKAGKGATIGAVTGGVLGLLAGPVGWAALGGAAIGGLAAKMHDAGFSDDRLKQVGAKLTPNSSALVAVIDQQWVAQVEQELMRQQADVVKQALSDDIQKQLAAGEDVKFTVVSGGDTVVAARATTGDQPTMPSTSDQSATPPTSDQPVTPSEKQPDQPPPAM